MDDVDRLWTRVIVVLIVSVTLGACYGCHEHYKTERHAMAQGYEQEMGPGHDTPSWVRADSVVTR